MDKTGESYAAARRSLFAANESAQGQPVLLATSDERIRERTGRGSKE